jgi:predicted nuclease of predicted toxin-antitoxin system
VTFLLNENISPALCAGVDQLGYKAVHVKDIGLLAAKDEAIFEYARQSGDIIITHDLDYSRIHAISGADKPSVILFRIEPVSRELIYMFLKNNLDQLKDELEKGAFVVVENDHIRVRELPIKKGALP